jgi:glycosyltransferase involved in cell wall biosynthesis/predicted flap endonuclease-1-like 5' DNA nuclease
VDFNITIVIPFYEGHDTIHDLLNSIPIEFPVVLVDDHSKEIPTVDRKNTNVFKIPKKGYFSGAVNHGIRECVGGVNDVLVLNQDVQFQSRRAFDLVLENRDQYALIGEKIAGKHPAWPELYVHGTFMFMRRDAIDKVGLLNEEYYPLWGSTCEWQLRACRQGFKALPTTIPDMIHKRRGNYGSSIQKLLKDNPNKRGKFIRTPPLVSVIVPTYNHGKYLPELVASLIGGKTYLGTLEPQSFQAFDVIIADDCSTDGTQEIMQDLADPWKGIKYVRTPKNSGTSVACNLAVQTSYAKYIARIDGDDMREAGSLEAMLKAQLANPQSFVYDDVQLITPMGVAKNWNMKDYDFDELVQKNFIHAGIMFPKEAWEEVGGYPEEMRHGRDDWAFNIALGLKGWCGVHLDRVGYMYRRHGENRTISNTTPANRAEFKRKIMALYPEAYAEVRPMACCGGSRPKVQSQILRRRVNGEGGTYAMGAGLPGQEGMVLVEFQGTNVGDETYYGPVTGSAYTFSAKKKQRWVDPRDLQHELSNGRQVGLLDIVDGRKKVFTVVRKPIKEKVAEATEIAEKKEEKPAPEVVEDTTKMLVPVEEDFFVGIKGVGKATSKKLVAAGFYSMEQLYETDPGNLKEDFGWSETKVENIREQLAEIILNP